MKDFVGRTIHIGDRVAYFCSTKNGSINRFTFEVKDFTKEMIVVYDQQSFGRKKRYISPYNCVVYKEVKNEQNQSDRTTEH